MPTVGQDPDGTVTPLRVSARCTCRETAAGSAAGPPRRPWLPTGHGPVLAQSAPPAAPTRNWRRSSEAMRSFQQTSAHCLGNRRRALRDAQLLVDVLKVRLDG